MASLHTCDTLDSHRDGQDNVHVCFLPVTAKQHAGYHQVQEAQCSSILWNIIHTVALAMSLSK